MERYNKNLWVTALLMLAGGMMPGHAAESNDTLKVDCELLESSRYTVAVKNVTLKGAEPFAMVVGNRVGRGTTIYIGRDSIWSNNNGTTTLIAEGLPGGEGTHDWTLARNSSQNLRLYRDNLLVGVTTEYKHGLTNVFGLLHAEQLAEGYVAEVVEADTVSLPDELAVETHIGEMLPADELTNLVKDPYCNYGFTRDGLNAETRNFYTSSAIFTGWGPEATIDTEHAYSGTYCVRLSGQAVYPDKGASLDIPVSMAATTTYLFRVMVKSEGYEGKLGIVGETDYIHITDTQGEWVQLEGVLTTSATRTQIYINNADFDNDGTLYVDNIEVYKAYSATSGVPNKGSVVAGVELKAGEVWSPTNAKEVYWVKFNETADKACSEIDPEKVTVKGSVSYTRTVEGSRLYALAFPGDLHSMTLTGYYDRFDYVNEPMVLGVDYVLQGYEAPYFHYLEDDTELRAGCYIAQFVDNIDGLEVTMNFKKEGTAGELPMADYWMVGNPTYATYAPEGTFLKFNGERGCFERVQGETISPFEAFIATTVYNPVQMIVPNGVSSFKRLTTDDGHRMSVIGTRGGIVINATGSGVVEVYGISGAHLKSVWVSEGSTAVSLPQGIYLVNRQKVVVR